MQDIMGWLSWRVVGDSNPRNVQRPAVFKTVAFSLSANHPFTTHGTSGDWLGAEVNCIALSPTLGYLLEILSDNVIKASTSLPLDHRLSSIIT